MNALQGKAAFQSLPADEQEEAGAGLEKKERKPSRRRFLWLVIGLAVLLAAGYVYRTNIASSPQAPAAAPVGESVMRLTAMEVAVIEPIDLRETARVSGSLAPGRQATIAPRTGGTLLSVTISPGDRVERGEVIAELDTDELESQRTQQESAIASLQVELRLAESQLESTRTLVERGSSSRSSLESNEAAVEGLQANLAAQRAQLATLELNLSNAVIRAPFDGVIASREADPGQTVGAGTPIAMLVDLTEMEVRASLSLSDAGRVAVGQDVELAVEGMTGRTFRARVDRINPVATEGTRSLPVYLTLDNPNLELRGGMFVTGQIIVAAEEEAITAPIRALREVESEPHVLVVIDDRLEQREVAIERTWNGGRVAQISEGLTPGEMIVAEPLPELAPGMAVTIEGN